MSAVNKVQDGGGDSLSVDKKGDQIKPNQSIDSPVHNAIDPYEGSYHQPTGAEKVAAREEELTSNCPHTDGDTDQQTPQQAPKPKKSVSPRRHEDHRNILQFDSVQEIELAKKNVQAHSFPSILTDRNSDDEMEGSPLVEDTSKEIRLKREQEYRRELVEQIAQREEKNLQQKARRNVREVQRSQEAANSMAKAAAAQGSSAAVESYENQIRRERKEEMRRQLAVQREREIQRLRRIYQKDDRKFLAHLQRLKLLDNDLQSNGDGDIAGAQRDVSSPKSNPSHSIHANVTKKSDLEQHNVHTKRASTHSKTDVSCTDEPTKVASPREIPPKKTPEKKDKLGILKTQPPSSLTPSTRIVDEPPIKPLTYKRAYLRLKQQRRAEERALQESRARVAAWRTHTVRQERLEKEVRDMTEWRSGHSLAGVPLAPISPSQRSKFEAAASCLEKQRAAQQEKRVERDRQLLNWREEKDRQVKERRMKVKVEQEVARELRNERRREAEKSFQRWIHEIRARKAAERASVPRGATGVSTYSSAYSLPSPWRSSPKHRGGSSCLLASLSGKGNENVPRKVVS